jgi:tRNA dimethylallyltransferase
LEVCVVTNKPFSSFLVKEKKERPFTPICIALNIDREDLYKKINKRVDEMMQNGLLEEVKQLAAFKEFNALKTVGYKELFEHLEGKITLPDAVTKIKQHTRNYAKRQITWFKNKGDFEVFKPNDLDKIKAYIDIITSNG